MYKHKTKTRLEESKRPIHGQKKNHANHYCIYDRNVKRNERETILLTEIKWNNIKKINLILVNVF
jgi:hypothetical protein